MAKVVEEMCACVPSWYAKTIALGEAGCCANCGKGLQSGELPVCQTLMIPCFTFPGRIHANAVMFHKENDCGLEFKRKTEETGWARAYDLWNFTPFTVSGNVLQAAAENCLKNHQRTGGFCGACGIYGEKGNIELKICSGCNMTRYCSKKCQNREWKTHKGYCRQIQKSKKQSPPKNKIPICPCFNEADKSFTNSYNHSICSNQTCQKPVKKQMLFSTFFTECMRGGLPHIIPTNYCSVKCREREMSK